MQPRVQLADENKMAAATYRKVLATKLTTNFREACQIVQVKHHPLGDKEVLIKNR